MKINCWLVVTGASFSKCPLYLLPLLILSLSVEVKWRLSNKIRVMSLDHKINYFWADNGLAQQGATFRENIKHLSRQKINGRNYRCREKTSAIIFYSNFIQTNEQSTPSPDESLRCSVSRSAAFNFLPQLIVKTIFPDFPFWKVCASSHGATLIVKYASIYTVFLLETSLSFFR